MSSPSPSNWFQRLFARAGSTSQPHAAADQLELARAHARNGKLFDASHIYSQLCRNSASVELRLEFARLLLDLGDRFGAAAESSRVLELEPDNAAALEIRSQVLRMEESGQQT